MNAPERPSALLPASPLAGLAWDNRYAGLPGHFFTRLQPEPLPAPFFVADAR